MCSTNSYQYTHDVACQKLYRCVQIGKSYVESSFGLFSGHTVEPELLPIDVLHCTAGIGNFVLLYCRDLDVDSMTFIYELDAYSLKISSRPEN